MKACFTPHVMMHSLFAFGLALAVASFVPGLVNLWLGVVLMVVAFVLDATR